VLRERTDVADDVRVAERDAEGVGRVDARVHAGEDEVFLGGWKGEVALRKGGGVVAGSLLDLLLDGGHGDGLVAELIDTWDHCLEMVEVGN
jgi:hypothetical protein